MAKATPLPTNPTQAVQFLKLYLDQYVYKMFKSLKQNKTDNDSNSKQNNLFDLPKFQNV